MPGTGSTVPVLCEAMEGDRGRWVGQETVVRESSTSAFRLVMLNCGEIKVIGYGQFLSIQIMHLQFLKF